MILNRQPRPTWYIIDNVNINHTIDDSFILSTLLIFLVKFHELIKIKLPAFSLKFEFFTKRINIAPGTMTVA